MNIPTLRITHILSCPIESGAGLGVLALARALKDEGAVSSFVGRVTPLPNSEFACFGPPIAERIWVGLRTRAYQRGLQRQFGKPSSMFLPISPGLSPHRHWAVREADIVNIQWSHAATLGPAFWNWLQTNGSRVVLTLRDMWPFTGGCHFSDACTGYTTGCIQCPLLGNAPQSLTTRDIDTKQRALAGIGAVIAISDDIAQRARASVVLRNSNIHVIPNAIDIRSFPALPKAEARARLGLPLSGPIVAFGALDLSDRRKGSEVLQQIVRDLGDTPGLHWATFGANPFAMPPATTAFGLVKDRSILNTIYAAADVFLMPSLQETFGKVTAEALASGTAVIAFRDTPAQEILDENCGWLVPHNDAAAMTAALRAALSMTPDGLTRMGLAGVRRIGQHFAPQNIARQHLELYRTLLARLPVQKVA